MGAPWLKLMALLIAHCLAQRLWAAALWQVLICQWALQATVLQRVASMMLAHRWQVLVNPVQR